MKKFVSIILTIIMTSLCVVGCTVVGYAEDVSAPDMRVFVNGNRYSQQYILNESTMISAQLTDESVFDRFAKVVVDLSCNKEVVIDESPVYGMELRPYLYTETETGYRAEINGADFMAKYTGVSFLLKAIAKGDPAVSFTAVGITKEGLCEDLVLSVDIPNNKVYEKDEIPHIVTEIKPPVFGDKFLFTSFGHIFAYKPQTPTEIMRMLSSSDSDSVIKYLPADAAVRENVVSGDIFALEFEGKLCDFVQVFVMGDANSDGLITSADARAVLRYAASLETDINNANNSCDVNHDGSVNAADARMILRVAAQLDYFRFKDVTVWQNQQYKIGPLVSASDGGFLWRCTVSEENAIEITGKIEQSVDNAGKTPEEIIVGAPALQTFILKPLKQGEFYVHFELIRSWESEPIEEFGFTVVVDDIL